MKTNELRQQRAKLIAEARSVLDAADKENREPTAEERGRFDAMMADAGKLQNDYERIEKLEAAERSITETRGRQTDPDEPGRKPGEDRRGEGRRSSAEYRSAYESYLAVGQERMDLEERRALSAESDTAGGYLASPQQMASDLIKDRDNLVVIRQLARKITIENAQSLGAPSLDSDPSDADWTSELQTGSEDSAMSFGKRELHPWPLAKRIRVSNKLLQLAMGAEGIVRERLAYKFAVSEEQAFMTGDGAGKPLGVFAPSANGISTSRDVSTDNTTTAITFDGLINAKYSLKSQYHNSPSLRWIFHRDAVKQLMKIKDTVGKYIWQPSVVAGQPDSILETPVVMSEYCPNTFTTGQYVGILGDFSHYWIADSMYFAIQRLAELYAEANQTGFIGRLEVDGMPVLEEAFVRVKLA
jgi:HK97 family phage major capsid protein